MRVFHGFDALPHFVRPAVTVGSYDGVHLGHRALIGRLIAEARVNGGESIVLTFEPHPRITLGKAEGLRLLTTLDEKTALLEELGDRVITVRGRLVLARGTEPAAWAQNVWTEPRWIPITSIGSGARQLSALQRNWRAHIPTLGGHVRRLRLMQEQLPYVAARPLHFGTPAPSAPLGAFTLWEKDLMLASPRTTSPFADGEVQFVENREDPPGRAYLKLWEVFTLTGRTPAPGELCIDLGAAPGGWTWVLGRLGCRVFSVDKAELAPQVAAMPGVNHCLGSGFGLEPRHVGQVDWLFSDMICYPDRLLETCLLYTSPSPRDTR